ncbi:DNA adenine methylase, partial [Butyricicoccus sp. 1XD8-22]
WYVTVMQSFSTNMSSWKPTKSKSRRGMAQSVSQWLGHIENNLPLAVERMKYLQVENMDFKELLVKYDNENTLFYLDPPYIHETRKMTYTYEHELENERHKELVDILLNVKGKCILSGYDHEIYDELELNGWSKVYLGEFAKRSIKTIVSEKEKGKEFVWINYTLD